MEEGTIFDLASLTKVVATLPAVLSLVADGAIALDTPVADVLAGFAGGPAGVTVEHLLTHSSGLPPHLPLWQLDLDPAAMRARVLGEPLVAAPGTVVAYSDLGFLTAGWVVEAVTGSSLDAVVAERVTAPLGMAATGYRPPAGADVAATERRPDGTPVVGTVHDENAAAFGIPVGHAGLWSTAADLGRYLVAWVGPGDRWLPWALRTAATADRTAGLARGDGLGDGGSGVGAHRGLGWVARGDAQDHLGERWPATAASHSGFTGTSVALDLPSRRWAVLLTNDVHLGRGRGRINPLRRAVNDALAP